MATILVVDDELGIREGKGGTLIGDGRALGVVADVLYQGQQRIPIGADLGLALRMCGTLADDRLVVVSEYAATAGAVHHRARPSPAVPEITRPVGRLACHRTAARKPPLCDREGGGHALRQASVSVDISPPSAAVESGHHLLDQRVALAHR